MENKFNGHEIIVKDGETYFKDTGQPTIETWKERGCGECNKPYIADGNELYDGCMGKLTGGVINACCGHGETDSAYVQFDSSTISGEYAREYIRKNSETMRANKGVDRQSEIN